MKKKVIEKFIFEGFGFPVILRNVIVENYDGEEFPDINYNELKVQTVKALIVSSKAFNGAQLKFLRTFMKKSLRDICEEIGVSHVQVKNWEDKEKDLTGMTPGQERKLKNHLLNFLISLEQRIMSDILLSQEIDHTVSEGPFDPCLGGVKYG